MWDNLRQELLRLRSELPGEMWIHWGLAGCSEKVVVVVVVAVAVAVAAAVVVVVVVVVCSYSNSTRDVRFDQMQWIHM